MKKSVKKIACLIVITATTMGAAMAQTTEPSSVNNKKVELSVHLGGGIPLGFWMEEEPPVIAEPAKASSPMDGVFYGTADLGIDLGIKAKYNIPQIKGLGIMATADVFFNTSNNYKLTDTEEGHNYVTIYKYQNYFNIPLMLGLNYNHAIGSNLSIWGEAAIGANLRIITNYEWGFGPDDTHIGRYYSWIYENTETLAFQAGAGMTIKDKVSLGLHYYHLGSKDVMGVFTAEYPSNPGYSPSVYPPENYGKLDASMLVVRVGYHF